MYCTKNEFAVAATVPNNISVQPVLSTIASDLRHFFGNLLNTVRKLDFIRYTMHSNPATRQVRYFPVLLMPNICKMQGMCKCYAKSQVFV